MKKLFHLSPKRCQEDNALPKPNQPHEYTHISIKRKTELAWYIAVHTQYYDINSHVIGLYRILYHIQGNLFLPFSLLDVNNYTIYI